MFVETDDIVMHRDTQGPAIGSHAALMEKMRDKRQAEKRQQDIELVVDNLRYGKFRLSDFLEEPSDLTDMIVRIVYDSADDKYGRITDAIDNTLTAYATWLVDSPNTSHTIPIKIKLGVI